MTIKWGILSTGMIAHKMADAVKQVEGAELLAVGSRTQASAEKFGDEFGIARRYGSYEALVADPDIDVIYIAPPHPWHHDTAIMAMEHGKAVICEKPLAMNAKEAAEMIRVARERNVFLMEAMWTRFMPTIVKLRELIAAGTIGEPRFVQADFGFRAEFREDSRLFSPELGGGALLDVGIYPVSFASMIFGRPSQVLSAARLGTTGVDEESAALFKYPNGAMAQVYSATRLQTPLEAHVSGTNGRIKVHARFYATDTITVTHGNGWDDTDSVTYTLPTHENGFVYEAAEVVRCLNAGLKESPDMTLDDSLMIMEVMDQIQAGW